MCSDPKIKQEIINKKNLIEMKRKQNCFSGKKDV